MSTSSSINNTLKLKLQGYTIGSNTPLAASDKLIDALGKIQGQISGLGGVGGYIPLTGTTALAGSIIPNANILYNLGSANFRFESIFSNGNVYTNSVRSYSNSTALVIGDSTGIEFARFVSSNGNLVLGGSNFAENGRKLQVNGSANITGSLGIGTSLPTHSLTLNSTATGITHYNTVDQTTNFERIRQYWNSSTYAISSEFGGTGIPRSIFMGIGFGRGITVGNIGQSNTASMVNINDPNSNGNTSVLSLSGQLSAISGINNVVSIIPNNNQTATGGYRMLWISPSETSTGSGSKFLIDAGVNSSTNGAGTHTSRFSVDSSGNGYFLSNITSGGTLSAIKITATSGNPGSVLGITSGSGAKLNISSYTHTDLISAASAVNTHGSFSLFGASTLAATNTSVTYTNATTLYIAGAPTAGTNVTITNPYALFVNSGSSYFGGNITLPNTSGGIAYFNTADQTTNWERVRQYWSGNVYLVSSESGGTGVARSIFIGPNTGRGIQVGSPPNNLIISTVNITDPNLATLNASLLSLTTTARGDSNNILSILPTINQTGTAGYKSLWLSTFEQTVGSGSKFLIDVGTNTASNGVGTHTSRFSVDNTGATTIFNKVDIYGGSSVTTFGSDGSNNSTRTNTIDKVARIGVPHYSSSSNPMALLTASSFNLNNQLSIGGGTAAMTAATEINFYTATNNTTNTGTLQGKLFGTGNWFLGTTPVDSGYKLDVAGTVRSTLGANFSTTSGNVGIGVVASGTYKLEVSGSVGASAYYETSDERLKDIHEYNPDVDLSDVNVIKYSLKGTEQLRYGYSAQQVKEILPELTNGENPLTVNYIDLHTLKILQLEKRINNLESQLYGSLGINIE